MKTFLKDISIEKSKGQFYTPDFIVSNILNMSGYYGSKILKKHVIDNSCGDGAFLTEIVSRYCTSAQKEGIENHEIAYQLGFFIHGIEIDFAECEKCKKNVDAIASHFGIYNVNWDIRCGDTMLIHEYDGKMDFVLGNPPYIRVHNVGELISKIKTFDFAQSGMTDLYIVFYEIGLKMLNDNGVLGYITPNSFFNSIAGEYMRKYVVQHNLIEKIIDMKHYQAFSATTYTTITVLRKAKKNNIVSYYQFDEKNRIPYYVDDLTTEDFFIGNNFYFSSKKNLQILKKIFFNTFRSDIAVKNGFATLCDTVFIKDFDFRSQYIIPVIKASTGKKTQIIYPYDNKSKLIPESILKNDSTLYNYLLESKKLLLKRSNENDKSSFWYAYGRSQAINDTYKDKITINTLVRNTSDLKLIDAPPGTGVYSGLYIVSNTVDKSVIRELLMTDDFILYVSLLGKYKSGGYYTFSSKEVKIYLDYAITSKGETLK